MTLLLLLCATALAAPLRVEIRGLQADGAPVLVYLFNTPDAFPSMDKAHKTYTVVASASTLSLDLGELPPGTWALSIHHDQNRNGKLDFQWLPPGPAEGTSASCASKPLAMPSWEDCRFTQGAQSQTLRLQMWY